MSFNWADEVEEELAEAAGHGQSSTQFEQLHEEDMHSEEIRSDLTPQVESTAAGNESTSSTAHPRNTPSPEHQPSARNSGIMQSRWATAPDEPVVVVVEPDSEVTTKDTTSLEQGGHGTPSRSRRARGTTSHGKRDSTQSVRSGRSSLAGSPKKTNREGGNKQAKARTRSTSTSHTERAHITTPLVPAHTTSPKINNSLSPSKSASGSGNAANNHQLAATAVDSGIAGKTIDGPVQTPGSSPTKNEISLSRWA